MKQVTYKVNVDTKGAVKEVDELNDSIKETGKDARDCLGKERIHRSVVGRDK